MQRKPASKQRGSGRGSASETCHLNSSVESLKSNPWQLLLSRIGDALMLHLLMHAAIFQPLQNGCFLQLTGVAVDQVFIFHLHPKRMCSRSSIVGSLDDAAQTGCSQTA